MQQTRALHIGLLLCVVLICINVSDAAKSKGGVSTRGGGGGGGGGGLDLGGFDLGSLLQGLGSTKDGGLQFKFHGKYCGLGHGDATYLFYCQLLLHPLLIIFPHSLSTLAPDSPSPHPHSP